MIRFFENQPHPETNESACTVTRPDAVPLAPAAPEDAVACACAYIDGQYQLLLAPKASPDTVMLYRGKEVDALEKTEISVKVGAPIRAISWLLRPQTPLMCIHAGQQVRFFDMQGQDEATVSLDAASATAYDDGETAYLVTDEAVHALSADLQPTQEIYPIQAAGCLLNNQRMDALWKTGRTNPGTVGGMLFSHEGKTHYVCGDTFRRCALDNIDTFICEVHSLSNPYSRRYLAIPNGGAACLFAGENGRVFAAFVGATPYSGVYGKAAILPMDYREDAFFRPDGGYLCETVPSTHVTPRGGIDQIRDSFLYAAPDGMYYLTGTTLREGGSYWSYTNGIQLWRSRDMETFEPLGKVYDYLDTPDSWQNHVSRGHNCWAPEMIWHEGTFWLTYSTAPGCGLLKSTSGKPEGPYVDMGRVVHKGIDSGFFQEDGVLYLIWQNGRIAPLSADGRVMLQEPVLLLPTDGQEVGYEGAGLIKVRGKYVLYAAEWNGDARIDGTYDMMYSVSDNLMGPYCPRRLLAPHAGHGCLFYDFDGVLRYTMFGNDRTAPFRHSVGIGEVFVEELDGILTLGIG